MADSLQSLNEKLARWAGLQYGELPQLKGIAWYGKNYHHSKPPDFTSSLDACFEWLVPKLLESQWKLSLSWCGNPPGKPAVHLAYWGKGFTRQNRPQISMVAETPALALCLAVRDLLGKEEP